MITFPQPTPNYPKGAAQVSPSPELAFQTLPDLSRPLRIMDLCFRIETKLAGVDNMIADSVRLAMHNGTPYIKVVEMLKSMAEDNRHAIEYMIGVELTKKLMEI